MPEREIFWTPSRRELLSWLQRNTAPLAELYQGAVTLAFESIVPGRFRLVAHAVREIGNRLPDAIAGPKGAAQVKYKERMDEISGLWRQAGLAFDAPTNGENEVPSDPHISVPRHLYRKLSELIDEHERGSSRNREAAERLFDALEDGIRGAANVGVINQWLSILGWFVGRSHNWSCLDADQDGGEFKRKFELFESSLIALVGQFFSTVSELDEVLDQANS